MVAIDRGSEVTAAEEALRAFLEASGATDIAGFHSRLRMFRTRQQLSALKAWCKALVRARHLPFNPASEIELPKRARQLPRTILSISDVEALLRAGVDELSVEFRLRPGENTVTDSKMLK